MSFTGDLFARLRAAGVYQIGLGGGRGHWVCFLNGTHRGDGATAEEATESAFAAMGYPATPAPSPAPWSGDLDDLL